jgi:hypothetical protein
MPMGELAYYSTFGSPLRARVEHNGIPSGSTAYTEKKSGLLQITFVKNRLHFQAHSEAWPAGSNRARNSCAQGGAAAMRLT